MLMKHGLFKGSYQHTNFRIHPRGKGTKWYLEEIQAVKNGVCTISFDGCDKSRNIEVPEDKNSIERTVAMQRISQSLTGNHALS